jgi:hypothetical protein
MNTAATCEKVQIRGEFSETYLMSPFDTAIGIFTRGICCPEIKTNLEF